MATALYNCEIGKEIKITDSGGTAVFFVADHYTKGSEYHTVVLRKDSISTSRMSSNIYLSCTDMQNYLNNDYYNSIEEVVRKYIANSDIQCADSSGNIKMIQGYICPPSARELGGETYGTNMDCYPEGSPFAFFKRYSVGDYAPWNTIATRSTMKSDDRIILRTQRGFGSTFYRNVSYVNPTFSIKKGLYINSDGTLFAPKPSVPSNIKYNGEPFIGGNTITISWNKSSIEGDIPIKYEVSSRKNSGSWNVLGVTSSLSLRTTLPTSIDVKTVTYRVRAQSSNGDEYSDYATGPVITVLHNSAPSVPNGITFSTPITVSTEGSTDIDNDPIVYEFERQIDSSEWTSVEMTFNKSTTDTVPSSGEYINYRVRARDNYGNRSAYTTGVKQLISYLPGVTNPGKPMYKYPISGLDMDITWGAAASEDASLVTYAVEVKIDDGEWIDRGQTSQTEFKFYIPRLDEEGHTIQVRIKAKIPNGSESEYSTGKVTEILYHKVRRLIPWNFGTDFRIRQFTKNSRSQYQTMLAGSTAKIIATGNLRLGDMPVGTLVRVSGNTIEDINWKIADQNHPGYPENSTTLITDKAIRIMPADAKEPDNREGSRYVAGNNRYILSNIHQWLNSDAAEDQWYTLTHEYDKPPIPEYIYDGYNSYKDWSGFLKMLNPSFVKKLLVTSLKVGIPDYKETPKTYDTFNAKMFLASGTEVGFVHHRIPSGEGSRLKLFHDNDSRYAYPSEECLQHAEWNGTGSSHMETTKPIPWRLRSPYYSSGTQFCGVTDHLVDTDGIVSNFYVDDAYSGLCYSIRPLCNISADTLLNPNPNPDGSYNIVWE